MKKKRSSGGILFNREEAAPFILFSRANLKNHEAKVRAAFPGQYGDRVLRLCPASTDGEARRDRPVSGRSRPSL